MTALLRCSLALLLLGLFAPSVAAQGPLTLPARVSGELTQASERVELTLAGGIRPADRYTFTLSPGQSATVQMESTAFDTYLKIFQNGAFHSRNDDLDGSRDVSQVVLTSAGSYTVLAGAFSDSNNLGHYTLSVTSSSGGAVPTPPQGARELPLPGAVTGRLTSSSERVALTLADDIRPADRYTFSLGAGQQATVRMESSAFDTYLKVFRNGEYHSRNDDHEGSRDVSQVSLSSPGTYTVLAGAFSSVTNTGPYELAVTLSGSTASGDPPSTPSGGDGGTQSGMLTNDDPDLPLLIAGTNRKADTYSVELRAGEVLVVTMESDAFDTYLAVSINSEIIARNDDDGSTQRSRVRYTVPSDGQYYIYAGTFTENGRGSYTFSWAVE